MHIAYLIPTIDRIGGAERQLIHLATGMANRGWRVTVIALSGNGGFAAQQLSANDVSFISLEMRRGLLDPRGWIRLRRWISSAKPKILHAHLPHASLMARCIRLLAPIPVVIDTIHSPATGGMARQIQYRLTSRLPTMTTAVSNAAAAPWLSARMVNHSDLLLIANGVDTDHWKTVDEPDRYSPTEHCDHDFHWLSVGRLDSVKDHATLLRAFAMLPDTARLTIAGTGPLESALRLLASDLQIDRRVAFIGFQHDVRYWMQQADAFVLSSRWEGLPLALMEASACELPSVFTAVPGSRELLPNSPIAPVPIGNPQSLASSMQSIMDSSASDRRKMGEMARHEVTSRFDLNSVLSRYECLYFRTLALNSQPSCRGRAGSPLPAPARSNTTEI